MNPSVAAISALAILSILLVALLVLFLLVLRKKHLQMSRYSLHLSRFTRTLKCNLECKHYQPTSALSSVLLVFISLWF